ncbi:MAG TPA: hypothetical protein DCE78_08775 [Bacteroidetes bacterium]|nr:hypothetical protein [Bacteroidota bacterium]
MIQKSLLTIILFITLYSHATAQVRTIELPDHIFLSAPQFVANEKHFGILDPSQKKFFLFDYESASLISKLDATDSFPGFKWNPIRAEFLENEVFFTNSMPWGVYISYDNKVTHVAGRHFKATGAYDFLNDSLYVGFYTERFEDPALKGVDRDGNIVIEFEEVPIRFPNLAYRSEERNHVLFLDDTIYLMTAFDNWLHTFSTDGHLLKSSELKIDGFRSPTRDKRRIEPGNMQAMMHEFIQVTRDRSSVAGFYALNSKEILIVSHAGYESNDKFVIISKFNVDTGNVDSKWTSRSTQPAFAQNDKVYFMDIESEPVIVRIVPMAEYWESLD